MSEIGQSKFIGCLVFWGLGLFIAQLSCESLSGLKIEVLESIPAISSYANAAAPDDFCVARALWMYAWIVAPVAFLYLTIIGFREPVQRKTSKQMFFGFFFFIGLFVAILGVNYYGIYDPYPGSSMSRWAAIYRGSEVGVFIVTAIAWCGLYSIYLMSVILVTDVFKSK